MEYVFSKLVDLILDTEETRPPFRHFSQNVSEIIWNCTCRGFRNRKVLLYKGFLLVTVPLLVGSYHFPMAPPFSLPLCGTDRGILAGVEVERSLL